MVVVIVRFYDGCSLGRLRTPPPPLTYTCETGTIWQIGVLTAEWSVLEGQENLILGRFMLRFQCLSC